MNAIRLKTEYLIDPIGIDITVPRLFWNCEGGIRQTAYQVIAHSEDGTLLWDSGKTESNSMHTDWNALPVPPRTKVLWKVRLWDETDAPGDWSEAAFETGLPKGEPWRAKWISGDYTPNKKQRYPVDCFCRDFILSGIHKARLYITACGIYEAKLNGQRVGDFILAPGVTDYRKRVQYQTYDVTSLLRTGGNRLTVELADGWYRGSCGAWGLRNQYGTQTKLLAQLEVTDEAGNLTTIYTDESWRWSDDGPIRQADNKDGELVDLRREPSYRGKVRVVFHGVIPTASNNVPVREKERFSAKLLHTPSGRAVLDFGQNIAGYVSFAVQAKAGQHIKLRFGEMLDESGEFTQKNIQCSNKKITTPRQRVICLCRDGRIEYKTSFAIFGFRYVLVEADMDIDPADFTAIAVYSDMERTGYFESSNELLNRFFDCTVWSAKNNSCDLPTDCPTRERHGWTGDAQIFCPTASYLFDYSAFAQKYQADMRDAQRKDGCFAQIVPVGGVDVYMNVMNGSAGWSDAGVLIPYFLYKRYGDERILQRNYDAMRRYAEYKIKTMGKWYFTSLPTGVGLKYASYISNYGQSYGEWAEPVDVKAFSVPDFICPHPEETTAYLVYMLEHIGEIARILGREDDRERFLKYANRARIGYQRLIETKGHSLDTDRQAKLVRPLYMDLLDVSHKEFAKKRLIQALENYGWRVGTGFLSTPLILDVLSEIDLEAAYRLLENEEMPGWLFMPKMGATTIWESWEGTEAQSGVASLDHYSKGAVCQWLFETMGGIHVDGENHFTIAPRPGGHFTHVSTEYTSIYGKVKSGWQKNGKDLEFFVSVPAGCSAHISLPDGTESEQMAGEEVYKIALM